MKSLFNKVETVQVIEEDRKKFYFYFSIYRFEVESWSHTEWWPMLEPKETSVLVKARSVRSDSDDG